MGHTPSLRFLRAAVWAFGLALSTAPAAAQVVINEILPNPVGTDDNEERIEIYNAGASAVNMTGWAVDDAATIDQVAVRFRIPEDLDPTCSSSAIIGPGEFRVLKLAGTSALNNNGDDVYLVSDRLMSATVVHSVTYPDLMGLHIGEVWSALPNGSGNFNWRSPTLCASNGGSGDVTPPDAVGDLAAAPGLFPGEIRLTWTAPGDDGAAGTASNTVIKVAFAPITAGTFGAAADLDRWLVEPLPHAGGTPETLYVSGFDPDSTYHFALETQDEAPNASAISNGASTTPLGGAPLDPDLGYSTWFGNLHSHSSYSDGVMTPADAYDFARFTAPTPLDFLAVTDHNHVSAGMQLSNYALGMSEAAAANDDGHFVAIWGQEWGLATNGHVNIFEAPVLFGWDPGQHDVFVAEGDYAGLYTAALAHPPAGHPVLLSWCHPQSGDFNSMDVTADGLASVHLIALVNGPSTSTSTTESDIGNTGFDNEFQDALRAGYRVSPIADQDNHNATWGAATESRTAVLAAGLTKGEVLSALAAGRNYATQDHNAVVAFSADGHPMGADFIANRGIRIAARLTDPDLGESVAQVDVYRGITGAANAAVVATSFGNGSFAWRDTETFADGTEAHYYLRIRMADNQAIWTGPVYVTYDALAPVSVGDRPPSAATTLVASPYPAFGRVTASFTLPRATRRAALVVYDAGGRRVSTLLDGPLAAGSHQIAWAGHGDDGRVVAAGLFFLRLETEEGAVTRKVLLLR